MRLPYVQVAQKYLTAQSRVVAGKLGVSHAEAIGLGVQLFTFIVEATSTDESPPTGMISGEDATLLVESGIDWRGEPGKAVAAFVRADVIEVLDCGLRVKGCSRYFGAWKKQHPIRSDEEEAAISAIRSDAGRIGGLERKRRIELDKVDAGSKIVAKPKQTGSKIVAKPKQNVALDADADAETKEEKNLVLISPEPPEDPEPLKTLWNGMRTPDLPEWTKTGAVRKRLALQALARRRVEGPDGWRESMGRLLESPFCRGHDGPWRADPDWWLRPEGRKPETAQKLLDGSYGASPGKKPKTREYDGGIIAQPPIDAVCESCGDPARAKYWDKAFCYPCLALEEAKPFNVAEAYP